MVFAEIFTWCLCPIENRHLVPWKWKKEKERPAGSEEERSSSGLVFLLFSWIYKKLLYRKREKILEKSIKNKE